MFLRILAGFFLSIMLVLSCGDDITNNYYPSTGGAVFGNVVPADGGLATLYGLVELSTPLDANGFFNFADVPPGTYTLVIRPQSFSRRQFQDVIVGTGITAQYRDVAISKLPFPIYSISPVDSAVGVYVGTGVQILSDEILNIDDLNNKTTFEPAVQGSWLPYDYYDYGEPLATSIYYYALRYALAPSTVYRMVLDREIRTESGQTLDDDLVLTFTTQDVHVYFEFNESRSTNRVSRRGFRASAYIGRCATPDSVSLAIRFEPEISGVWQPSDYYPRCQEVGQAREFDFLATNLPLAPRTTYHAIFDGSFFGSSIEDTSVFLTEGYEVIKVLPRNGYYGVPTDNQVLVVFNEPMDTLSARQALTVTRVGGDEVPGTYAWNAQRTEMMYSHWDHPYTTGQYIIKVTRQALTEAGDTLDVGWDSYFQVL